MPTCRRPCPAPSPTASRSAAIGPRPRSAHRRNIAAESPPPGLPTGAVVLGRDRVLGRVCPPAATSAAETLFPWSAHRRGRVLGRDRVLGRGLPTRRNIRGREGRVGPWPGPRPSRDPRPWAGPRVRGSLGPGCRAGRVLDLRRRWRDHGHAGPALLDRGTALDHARRDHARCHDAHLTAHRCHHAPPATTPPVTAPATCPSWSEPGRDRPARPQAARDLRPGGQPPDAGRALGPQRQRQRRGPVRPRRDRGPRRRATAPGGRAGHGGHGRRPRPGRVAVPLGRRHRRQPHAASERDHLPAAGAHPRSWRAGRDPAGRGPRADHRHLPRRPARRRDPPGRSRHGRRLPRRQGDRPGPDRAGLPAAGRPTSATARASDAELVGRVVGRRAAATARRRAT